MMHKKEFGVLLIISIGSCFCYISFFWFFIFKIYFLSFHKAGVSFRPLALQKQLQIRMKSIFIHNNYKTFIVPNHSALVPFGFARNLGLFASPVPPRISCSN